MLDRRAELEVAVVCQEDDPTCGPLLPLVEGRIKDERVVILAKRLSSLVQRKKRLRLALASYDTVFPRTAQLAKKPICRRASEGGDAGPGPRG